MTIRVLVVDDSRLVREILVDIVNSHPDMRVVGMAEDPFQARVLIDKLQPDVLTLDVEMPRMSGLQFLEKLMRARPLPVVMISAHTEEGSAVTLRALELGAVDFVPKPRLNALIGEDYRGAVAEKVRAAYAARVRPAPAVATPAPAVRTRPRRISHVPQSDQCDSVIVVGASTGGPEALRGFLTQLPADAPAVLVAQHMPEHFTRQFAQRLDGLCRMRVQEAGSDPAVHPGNVYIAPGGQHLRVRRVGEARFALRLSSDEPVNMHRPSVDVLFDSAADAIGARAVGVILTGMGKDGAAGLLRMKLAGAHTLAQDEASSVVFGMPREAIALGAVDQVVPIHDMAQRVLDAIRVRATARVASRESTS
ncbi:MAG TPA: chemotaxis response regulator protein-glutamate methylesterase [Burkholderiales bacterium]|nr:chemotaxis response regulator protein-glutamate methylesterase [Burkholderiales bacterium]